MEEPPKREMIRNMEVVGTILFKDIINFNTRIKDFQDMVNKLINKKVSFFTKDIGYGTQQLRFVITRVEFLLINNDEYAVFFYSDNRKFQIDPYKKVEIWTKKIISKEDPLGEEDWSS